MRSLRSRNVFPILDLPPELVEMIMASAMDADPKAIYHLRQTCRQFCEASASIACTKFLSNPLDCFKYGWLGEFNAVREVFVQRTMPYTNTPSGAFSIFVHNLHKSIVRRLNLRKDEKKAWFERVRTAATQCLDRTRRHRLIDGNDPRTPNVTLPKVTDTHVLTIACITDDTRLAQSVLRTKPGLDPEERSIPFISPWDAAIRQNSTDVADLLMERYAGDYLTISTSRDKSLLSDMASFNRIELVSKLLKNHTRYTPDGEWAGWQGLSVAAVDDNRNLAKVLLNFAPKTGVVRAKRLNFIASLALHKRHVHMARLILDAGGADLEYGSKQGGPALVPAALQCRAGWTLLLERLPEIKDRSRFVRAFVAEATLKNDVAAVRALLKRVKGDEEREDVLKMIQECAMLYDKPDLLMKIVLGRGAIALPVFNTLTTESCTLRATQVLEALLARTPVVKPEDKDNRFKVTCALEWALWEATKVCNIEAVEKLLAAGVDPNEEFEHGMTPLQLAARSGDAELVDLLITRGADVSKPDEYHNSVAKLCDFMDFDVEVEYAIRGEQDRMFESMMQRMGRAMSDSDYDSDLDGGPGPEIGADLADQVAASDMEDDYQSTAASPGSFADGPTLLGEEMDMEQYDD